MKATLRFIHPTLPESQDVMVLVLGLYNTFRLQKRFPNDYKTLDALVNTVRVLRDEIGNHIAAILNQLNGHLSKVNKTTGPYFKYGQMGHWAPESP